MPDNPELLACPWCRKSDLLNIAHCDGSYAVECKRCIVAGPEAYSEEEATSIWNTRAIPAPPEEREKLVELIKAAIAGRVRGIGDDYNRAFDNGLRAAEVVVIQAVESAPIASLPEERVKLVERLKAASQSLLLVCEDVNESDAVDQAIAIISALSASLPDEEAAERVCRIIASHQPLTIPGNDYRAAREIISSIPSHEGLREALRDVRLWVASTRRDNVVKHRDTALQIIDAALRASPNGRPCPFCHRNTEALDTKPASV